MYMSLLGRSPRGRQACVFDRPIARYTFGSITFPSFTCTSFALVMPVLTTLEVELGGKIKCLKTA
jgi:hypothetical protein